MEAKSVWMLVSSVLLVVVLFSSAVMIGSLNEDIRQYRDKIDNLEDQLEGQIKWRNYYENWHNNHECPKAETIWINNTEYINTTETIWNNQTLYIDNTHCDVTGDGRVDMYDVCSVLHYVEKGLSKIEELFYNNYPNPYEILYDVNRDGRVNTMDVRIIMEYSD